MQRAGLLTLYRFDNKVCSHSVTNTMSVRAYGQVAMEAYRKGLASPAEPSASALLAASPAGPPSSAFPEAVSTAAARPKVSVSTLALFVSASVQCAVTFISPCVRLNRSCASLRCGRSRSPCAGPRSGRLPSSGRALRVRPRPKPPPRRAAALRRRS